jgi:TPR repeat protein
MRLRFRYAAAFAFGGVLWLSPLASTQQQPEQKVFDRFPANTARELEQLREAAAQGEPDAQNDLGLLFRFGAAFYHRSGIEQDKTEAVKWFRLAAEQGLDRAEYNLALCYLSGDGVAKDPSEAFRWQSRAAAQGRAEPAYSLGLMYLNGDGVSPDAARGLDWIGKAAAQGLPAAFGRLGDAYWSGEGVARDSVEALKWFSLCVTRASARQQANCTVGRDATSNTLTPDERVEAQRRVAVWLQERAHR